MLKLIINNKSGLSYVELIAIIFIIAILSALGLANIGNSGRKGKVYVASQKIVSDIRQAQNFALSSKEFNYNLPEGGWGIYFNKDQDHYSIYADEGEGGGTANGDHNCLADCNEISAERYNNINFFTDVSLDHIYVTRHSDGVQVEVDEVHITFEPPDPITHICIEVNDCDYDSVEIDITDNYFNARKILVNFFGMIDAQEAFY